MPGDRRTLVALTLVTWAVLGLGLVLGWPVLTIPAGIVAILVVPGSLLLRALRAWPDPWAGLALSVGASLPISAAVALVTAALPVGSTLGAVAVGLALTTAVLFVPAVIRAPRGGPAASLFTAKLADGRAASVIHAATAPADGRSAGDAVDAGQDRQARKRRAGMVGSAVLTAALVMATIVVSATTEQNTFDQPLTQVGMSVVTDESQQLDRNASVTGTDRVLLTVANHEGTRTDYEVTVSAIESPTAAGPTAAGPATRTVFRERISVADAETWTRVITLDTTGPIVARVYGGSDTERGYREVRLGVR